ncbi:MAG: site-specific integrase [Clostridia bacterium]|nr:site-specific integrase [Clostridia bacterium]
MTLGSFAAEHYFKSVEGHLSPNTITFYRSVIEDIIAPSFGKIRLTDITSRHQQALIDYLTTPGARADKDNDKPLSASTVKRYATVFSSLMTEAHRMGFVEENKLRTGAVRYPKIKKESIRAYDRDEAAAFIAGLADELPRTRALLMTSLLTGLRRGEVVALKWEDVDFKKCTLSVNKSAYKEKGKPQALKQTKSPNSVRTVYFSQMYAQALLAWQAEQCVQREQAGEKWKEQGFVFTNEVGDMISLYAPTELCSDYEKRRGLRHLKLHGLRHTFGSLLLNNGADLETVKALMGHESIRTTEQYLTPYDAAKRKAAEQISAIIFGETRGNENENQDDS